MAYGSCMVPGHITPLPCSPAWLVKTISPQLPALQHEMSVSMLQNRTMPLACQTTTHCTWRGKVPKVVVVDRTILFERNYPALPLTTYYGIPNYSLITPPPLSLPSYPGINRAQARRASVALLAEKCHSRLSALPSVAPHTPGKPGSIYAEDTIQLQYTYTKYVYCVAFTTHD